MKISDYKTTYENSSTKLSDINRTIALAGIAIIWIFKKDKDGLISVDPRLILPAILFVFALTTDLFQYIYKTIAWAIFYRRKENKIFKNFPDDEWSDELNKYTTAPSLINYTTWVLFGLKIAACLSAYIFLLKFLFIKLACKQ